ncbi:hypothetical protein JJB46_00295 [Clostridium perfringens]|uniref:hypothetical protein n=1 Tax=Clostridium perfringens TaxID=1502 RepID=UPI00103B19FD|nr:hypothetical protein [Clostridium perfringens]MBO3386696.1 hypothetical protein [Clostridium perfringens]MBO3412092.1 hypothetical protein [Clostridium perfringens]
MIKIFELINEIIYDIIGYIIPGFFCIFLIISCFINGYLCTPMYSIFSNCNDLVKYAHYLIFPLDKYLLEIIILSYILGHLPSCFSILFNNKPFENIVSKLKLKDDIDNTFNYIEDLKLISFSALNDNLKNSFKDEDRINKFIKTYASTTSRFINHNNLIQKYIAKSKLYLSLATIFFLLLIDTICSLIILSIFYKEFSFSIIIVFIFSFVIILILFISFYREYYRHMKLREKESYVFLYETYIKN